MTDTFGTSVEVKTISAGNHVGVITKIEPRETEKYGVYLDCLIETEEGKISVSIPKPDELHERTQLGQLIKGILGSFEVGREYKPEEIVGKKFNFMTALDSEGKYVNVVKNLNGHFPVSPVTEETQQELGGETQND